MSYVIAIDGPGGAGKSTIAKLVAAKLGIIYVDTGAMYRAAAVFLNRRGIDKDDDKSIEKAVSDIDITFSNERVLLNGEDVSKKIRENDVSKMASMRFLYCDSLRINRLEVSGLKWLQTLSAKACDLEFLDFTANYFTLRYLYLQGNKNFTPQSLNSCIARHKTPTAPAICTWQDATERRQMQRSIS